ncbi:MAG: hypothetical protein ACOY4I_00465 [Bacillota bacterium]
MIENAIVQNDQIEKLIKWYGWIFILVLCLTPVVFVLLPVLMYNVSYFNRMIKSSKIPQEVSIQGYLLNCRLERKNVDGLNAITGDILVNSGGRQIDCSFLKYARKGEIVPQIAPDSEVVVAGAYDEKGVLRVSAITDNKSGKLYSTMPTLSVY